VTGTVAVAERKDAHVLTRSSPPVAAPAPVAAEADLKSMILRELRKPSKSTS
jgi:hypothetical protein